MNPLTFIPKWALAAAVAALGAIAMVRSAQLADLRVELAEQAASYQAQVADAQQALRLATQLARETELQLTAHAAEIQEKADEQVRVASARADDLRRRLRNAEARAAAAAQPDTASPAPAAPAFEPGSFGAQFPDTAGRLVDEAERAEVIRLNLLQCYASYDAAREALQRLAPAP